MQKIIRKVRLKRKYELFELKNANATSTQTTLNTGALKQCRFSKNTNNESTQLGSIPAWCTFFFNQVDCFYCFVGVFGLDKSVFCLENALYTFVSVFILRYEESLRFLLLFKKILYPLWDENDKKFAQIRCFFDFLCSKRKYFV